MKKFIFNLTLMICGTATVCVSVIADAIKNLKISWDSGVSGGFLAIGIIVFFAGLILNIIDFAKESKKKKADLKEIDSNKKAE